MKSIDSGITFGNTINGNNTPGTFGIPAIAYYDTQLYHKYHEMLLDSADTVLSVFEFSRSL
jgi:hypothetical protein